VRTSDTTHTKGNRRQLRYHSDILNSTDVAKRSRWRSVASSSELLATTELGPKKGELLAVSRLPYTSRVVILLLRRLLGVIDHALKVDHDYWFVSDNPPIVSWRNHGDIASLGLSLCAIIHAHVQGSRYLVLEMWSFTALRLCDRLDVSGPSPSRMEDSSSNRRSSNLHKLKFPFLKRSCLVGSIRTFYFQFAQCSSNHMHHRPAATRDCLFTKPQKGPHP